MSIFFVDAITLDMFMGGKICNTRQVNVPRFMLLKGFLHIILSCTHLMLPMQILSHDLQKIYLALSGLATNSLSL